MAKRKRETYEVPALAIRQGHGRVSAPLSYDHARAMARTAAIEHMWMGEETMGLIHCRYEFRGGKGAKA